MIADFLLRSKWRSQYQAIAPSRLRFAAARREVMRFGLDTPDRLGGVRGT